MTTSTPSPPAALRDPLLALGIGGRKGLQPQLSRNLEGPVGRVEARRDRPGRPGDLQRVDPHAAQPDHHDAAARRHPAARRHGSVSGADRTGQGRGADGIDLRGDGGQAVDRHYELLPEAPRRHETGPSLRVGALLLDARAAPRAPPARPQVVGDHRRAGLDDRRIAGDDPAADLVSGYVWECEAIAERHPAPGGLDVREADAAGQDLQQCVAGAQLRVGEIQELQRRAVLADGHPDHGYSSARGAGGRTRGTVTDGARHPPLRAGARREG